jgi:hypothetical protein
LIASRFMEMAVNTGMITGIEDLKGSNIGPIYDV